MYREQTTRRTSVNLRAHMLGDKVRSPAHFHPNRQRPWPSFYSKSNFESSTLESSYAIISQKVIGRTNIAILTHRKLHVAFRLAFLHLTLAHSKCQGKGHAHFDCQYLANGDRYGKHCYCIKWKVACGVSISKFKFDLGLFNRSTARLERYVARYFGLFFRIPNCGYIL